LMTRMSEHFEEGLRAARAALPGADEGREADADTPPQHPLQIVVLRLASARGSGASSARH